MSFSSSEDGYFMLSELVGSSSPGGKPVISDLCNEDTDDDVYSLDERNNESDNQILNSKKNVYLQTNNETKLHIGDFVCEKFAGKRSFVAFIGNVERIDGDEYLLSFLRWLNQSLTFIYPERMDKSHVNSKDILLKLKEQKQTIGLSLGLVFDSQQLITIEYEIC